MYYSFFTTIPRCVPVVRPAVVGTDKPAISIVIPAFNEAGFIADTLRSVIDAKRGYNGPVEIIVVDNNSTDATGAIARSFGVTVIPEPINQIARARNAGARAARSSYLVFLDADTRLQGDILDKVAANLSSKRVIGGGAWAEPDAGWIGRFLFKYFVNYALALRNVTVGPFLYCERAAFHRVGGFDETLYAAEEFSLARRLKAEGRKHRKTWKIIRYHSAHRVVTSSRKFVRFAGLELAVQNVHLIWKLHDKIRQKDQCGYWYRGR